MSLKISKLLVEYQESPLGLDEKKPRFSWLLESDHENVMQTACQISVFCEEEEVWDSGKLDCDESRGIVYGGEALKACTRYMAAVTIWDNYGESASMETTFETGLMDETGAGFDGAQWIGAPRYTVYAPNRGVFVLETEFNMAEADRAGVVFGANDYRLLDHNKNEMGLEGENFIRFEINLSGDEPKLDIYRVGYEANDKKEVPFASVPLKEFGSEDNKYVINASDKAEDHVLRVEIDGNNSKTYVDNILVDQVKEEMPFGTMIKGRTLNPRGHNDVITYPRLNEIGFFAGEGSKAYFRSLTVRNMRKPGNTFICEKPSGNLYGEESIFAGKLPVVGDAFVVENAQVTADPTNTGIPMLRTDLYVDEVKKVKKARLYITARGIYECQVNGQTLTDRVLAPGITQYDKRLNYQTYDITDKLNKGKNGLGVTIASGWWADAQTFSLLNYNYFGDKESLLAKVVVTYEDGTEEVCVTNTKTWKYFGEGPYRYAGLFHGEVFDGTKKDIYENYSRADFDDSAWTAPAEVTPVEIEKFRTMPAGFGRSWPAVNQTNPQIIGEYDAPVHVVDRRCACSRKELAEGIYIYDMEQNMAGVPRIRLHEEAGTEIRLRYAEVLYPDLPEYEGKIGTLMLENYRDASSTDVYICSGKEGEVYQPKFTFHGYRFVEISGVKHAPDPEEVETLQYSSVGKMEGSFESSNPLLNRFAQNVYWSQKCNFINIPTDCPQRNERMGWAGDTHVFCHTALNNSYLKQFYERNLQAMADLQTPEGQFPEIAPVGGGFGGITYETASIFMAWDLYQQYGDVRTLERFYPGIRKYMDYMKDKGLPGRGDMTKVGPLGDWLAPEETDLQLLWNAFYYRAADLMSRIAGILGKEEDQKEYTELAETVKVFWNKQFVDPQTKRTRSLEGELCDTQCSYVLGLEYGVMEDTEAAVEHLVRKTRALDHKVGTGFFGTGRLNTALSSHGYVEDAYKLMLQTQCPSWLYPVTQGATTIWEHWDSYTEERGFGGQNAMNSFNHYSLGSSLSWMYHTMLGIQPSETAPGYRHFELRPEVGPLTYAKGSVSSPYGTIFAGWEKKDGKVVYSCEIPVNTGATLYQPDGTSVEVGSGKHTFEW